jgi:hypothetical protein
MKEQHEVFLEKSKLGVVLHGARLGPRRGALDPCLLRLVPVLCAEPAHMAQWREGIAQRKSIETVHTQASCPASLRRAVAASADSHTEIEG